MRVDTETLKAASAKLKALLPQVQTETDLGSLRGLEGAGAAIYFDVFDRLILNHKDVFSFTGRLAPSAAPTRGNALLSFAYSLLANDARCAGSRRTGQLCRFSAHRTVRAGSLLPPI